MSLESNGYQFKPHEMPIMAGSPASPDHQLSRRIAYLIIGFILSLNAGLQNGLLIVSLPQLRGDLGLTLEQSGWIQVSYYMTYACMSIMFFKIRQSIGVARFTRISLSLMLISNLLQILFNNYTIELISRGFSGVSASGLMVVSMFYFMQGLPTKSKILGVALGGGVMQFGIPVAQIIMPALFEDGNIENIFIFQCVITFLCIGCVIKLPLPPAIISRDLTKVDLMSFALFATGIALFCGFLVQGRIVWWTTDWLGILLAVSILMTGLGLWIESKRHRPMLDWSWISTPQILMFGFLGAVIRVLTSEQTVGAAGLMATLGMTNQELTTLYVFILSASIFGLIMSLVTFKITDLRRPISIALLGIAIGSFLDSHIGLQTRPEQIYLSQSIIAFSTIYFFSPMIIEGLIRALAVSQMHIMSFSAVFGISQTVGGLTGAAVFSAFITYRSKEHLLYIEQYLSLTEPHVAFELSQLTQQFISTSNDIVAAQAKAMQALLSQATVEATIHAYNDLFFLIGIISVIAFIYTLITWIYRKLMKKPLLAKELSILMSKTK